MYYFAWGRMNPPTRGHLMIAGVLKGLGGSFYITKTCDNRKNPLEYKDKLRYAQLAFGPTIVDHDFNDIFDLLKHLEKQHEEITIVVGDDRYTEFQAMLHEYNGKEYNFKTIGIMSIDRNFIPVSSTQAREFAKIGDFIGFHSTLPDELKIYANEIYTKIREKLKEKKL